LLPLKTKLDDRWLLVPTFVSIYAIYPNQMHRFNYKMLMETPSQFLLSNSDSSGSGRYGPGTSFLVTVPGLIWHTLKIEDGNHAVLK
jgi:hypothetical protein